MYNASEQTRMVARKELFNARLAKPEMYYFATALVYFNIDHHKAKCFQMAGFIAMK